MTCRTLTFALDTAAFRAGGSVTATVSCAVDLGDLAGLKLPASRTISGPFVMMLVDNGRSTSASRHLRVRRYFPSIGWYGSVAVPIASEPSRG